MKTILTIFVVNLVALSFTVGSVILAYNGIEGWGWFIFGAIVTACTNIKMKGL